ncbi:ATP-dependent exoDNAse (exonuclease V) beta subunit (contains helicase and exonuclease domains) [Granulicella rosea]|uniref:DNA 3'-5' helicase n=1 Tax=Granulicella rosea TaxID=474952 RepID=A0A239EUV4_9BACT|nr:UvrD-helicase domain-containing protein [Granulicella rosea]SNS48201.1 ATP-dependent exoDNAse (exonuclease V) beta subunit (contains helicase and exonuclease domains) [Granulicella rosea]
MAELLRFPAATRPPTRPPDWQERERALDIRASWIVEAPAGSGKTGLLIQRFLKLLADETVTDPAQVLAITFTKKATSEMRERVLAQLAAAAAGREPGNAFDRETRAMAVAVLARDRALGWNLLADPRRMAIRTIDSVCSQIARALPVLSGSGGGQTPVEDSAELYKDAARRTLGLLGGRDVDLTAALSHLMLHRDGNLADCEALIADMLGWRDQWGELVPLAKSDLDDAYLEGVVLPKIERALEQAICRALTRIRHTAPPDILDELTTLAAQMAHSDGYKGAPSPIAICRELRTAPGAAAEDLAHWKALGHLLLTASTKNWRGGFNKNHVMFEIEAKHKEALKEIIARLQDETPFRDALCGLLKLPPLRYPHDQWKVTKSLFRVLSRALVELQIVFAERGECDFAEVGLLAKGALRRDAALDDLAIANGVELRHLLVDEMQDTSTSQYELIQLLTQSWDGRSQTVFLVGDPKQSIYLFRQARVERFVRTMLDGRLGEIAVGTLRLTANFRSQSALVAAFNDDFSLLFPREADPERPEEVPYVEADAVREATSALGEVWHAEVIPYSEDSAERTLARRRRVRDDAQQIRRIAGEWLVRPLPEGRTAAWKIAVLVRSRAHLTEIVAAFKAAEIPFRAVEIEALGERPEILDLLALTRALLHPADRVAWFALLRAPWCGLTLADLHLLAGADDHAWARMSVSELILQRGDLLSLDGIARLERLWPVMEAAVGQRGRLPVAAWVERTWRSLGADAFATDEELGNVRRYLRLLDELEQPGGGLRLPELTRRLGRLYAEPSAHPGAVDLMTIHGAKGLEWDAVIVPALERTGQSSRGRLLTWMEIEGGGEDTAHGILAPIGGKGRGSHELNEWMKSIEAAREAAERKRLFYVACTRAREELHLFAAPSMKKDGEPSRVANTLLHSAWAAAERHLRPAVAAITEEEPFVLALAASAAAPVVPQLQRIPTGWAAASDATILPYGKPLRPGGDRFERPDGSFAARAFGTATHGFLDLLAARVTSGQTVAGLLAELPDWRARIAVVLRSAGLPASSIERAAARVLLALTNTLEDPHGRWLLTTHAGAASEQALASSSERGLRMDRTFVAGPEPLVDGVSTRWIVDFKTATPGSEGMEEFLLREQAKYAGQMAAYAKEFDGVVRVGLYYPLLARFVWWVAVE